MMNNQSRVILQCIGLRSLQKAQHNFKLHTCTKRLTDVYKIRSQNPNFRLLHTSNVFLNVEANFNDARIRYETLKDVPKDKRPRLNALIKQATVGKVNCDRPRFYERKAQAEWDIWNEFKGMGKKTAMKQFTDIINELSGGSDAEDTSIEEQDLRNVNRDFSRLEPRVYNKLHKIPKPLSKDEMDVMTLSDLREKWGREGSASGVPLELLWPSKQELALMKEYDQVKYPSTVQELIAEVKKEKQEAIQRTMQQQKEVIENKKKLKSWIEEVNQKLEMKENEARLARRKREEMIEEVRQVMGMRIDPTDPKFLEALSEKEEEERKAKKALKKQKKQQEVLLQMRKLSEEAAKRDKKSNADKQTLPPLEHKEESF